MDAISLTYWETNHLKAYGLKQRFIICHNSVDQWDGSSVAFICVTHTTVNDGQPAGM